MLSPHQEVIPGPAGSMAQVLVLWASPLLRRSITRKDCQGAAVCLLHLLPRCQPGSGEPQTPEQEVILCVFSPRRYAVYKASHSKGACSSLLNGVINAKVVTVAQSTAHGDICSMALQTFGSSLYMAPSGLFWQQQGLQEAVWVTETSL